MTTVQQHPSSLDLAREICHAAAEVKAEEIVLLDVQSRTFFTDYFIIMSGRSTRHVQAIAEAIDKKLGRKRSAPVEGRREGHWILLDVDDVIVHIFYRESRTFYNLEELWHDAPRVPVTQTEGSPVPS